MCITDSGRTPDGARLSDRAAEIPEDTWDLLDELQRFADERGVSLLDVAIGGLAAMPAVRPVVVGATTSEQVRENARASDWRPSPADVEALSRLRPTAESHR
jgi:aryl-alcohol dehydrogenase-like predicted oxidoreductase